MWRIFFYSRKNSACRIDILNGKDDDGSNIVYLTASTKPFHFDYNDDEDVYCPVRLSSGNIGVLLSDANNDYTAEIKNILCATPEDRPVRFYHSAPDIPIMTQMWHGFVKTGAFDHPAFGCGDEFSIPVMSTLSILESKFITPPKVGNATISWLNFIKEIESVVGYTFEHRTGIPDATLNLSDYVKPRSPQQYTVNDDGELESYDAQSYLDVLKSMCVQLNKTIIEDGKWLRIFEMDRWISDTHKNFEDDYTLFGEEHALGVVEGKKSVTVTCHRYQHNHIFSLNDIFDMSGYCSPVHWLPISDYRIYEERTEPNPLYSVENNEQMRDDSYGVFNKINSTQPDLEGVFIETEGKISNIKQDITGVYEYDGSLDPCVLFVGKSNNGKLTINPAFDDHYQSTAVMHIEFEVKNSISGTWTKPSTPSADNYSFNIPGYAKEDKGTIRSVITNYNGEPITIQRNPSVRTEQYIKITKLEIAYEHVSVEHDPTMLRDHLNELGNDDVQTVNNTGGFTEEYSAEYTANNNFQAKNIAQRMARFYAISRSKYQISVDYNYVFNGSPEQQYPPYEYFGIFIPRTYIINGRNYNIISEKFDAAEAQLQLTLIEVPRN